MNQRKICTQSRRRVLRVFSIYKIIIITVPNSINISRRCKIGNALSSTELRPCGKYLTQGKSPELGTEYE